MPKLEIEKDKFESQIKEGTRLKKILSKKVKIIICIVIVVAVAFLLTKLQTSGVKTDTKYTVLSKGNIVNSINVSGVVKSGTSSNVYSTLDNKIKEVRVKVGDKVKAGDILAVLDSGDLEKDIEQAEATTAANEANNKMELNAAKKEYENTLYLYNNNLNSEIKNAEEAVNSAKLSLEDKENIYEYNKMLLESGEISKQELKQKKIDFENAKSEYDKAAVALENAKVKALQELDTAKNNYEKAQNAANNNSERIALEKQQSNLEKCQIKAPIDGTVTSVSAVAGDPGSGNLFRVEDLDNIEINASIKEIDRASIKVGQKAEIRTDSTGDAVIYGEVVSISPTANTSEIPINTEKSQLTNTSTNTSTEEGFEAKIKISEPNESIYVGMSTRANIILSEKSDIYTISYDSIVENDDGKSLYIAEKSDNNDYIVKDVPISTGLESDSSVEISGEGISDGTIIIDDPSTCKVGDKIQISG
ncbi:lipoprotein [Clostridium beijerinckii]|uniref:Efflux RND transporter periplasmic adaptor subunit n=1 Tax=Clostridium beijerinckii TaxID=1520 RepID=Q7WYT7_CLOBE|nr:efflux RND transporter periplasmic adaptor subunit [Clostridium beijerinckii]NRZ29502.1 multidrug efflux pump subunit AcrA (membrane-fusion protein) [Clostridium beijerinckii]NYC00004.1 multidrug efflux pump subunit AcrA (membrane-fusion protein) [Clostridium beijerinckii]OOM22379.1 macrolide export protein MacA [Clostridium beijerinckii]QUN37927.1 efflux RND transporter periplasmic adaptor subunit [Clostridium beijerinckii]CAD97585.1 putative hylD family protein [Clostridium beijerinckii]